MIKLLLMIGLVSRRVDGSIAWPFHAPPRHVFRSWQSVRGHARFYGWKPYRFRNKRGVVKWVRNRLLPWRWGGGWMGFEFGDRGSHHYRNPQDVR